MICVVPPIRVAIKLTVFSETRDPYGCLPLDEQGLLAPAANTITHGGYSRDLTASLSVITYS